MGRLLPVITPLSGAFRIDQDVRGVLHVAHLLGAFAHLEQGIAAGQKGVGRTEQQAVQELRAPATSPEMQAFMLGFRRENDVSRRRAGRGKPLRVQLMRPTHEVISTAWRASARVKKRAFIWMVSGIAAVRGSFP
jgi:hypothetical protein